MRNINNRIKKLETIYHKTLPTIIFIDFIAKKDTNKENLYYQCNGILFKNNTTMEDLEKRIIKQTKDNCYGIYIVTSINKEDHE